MSTMQNKDKLVKNMLAQQQQQQQLQQQQAQLQGQEAQARIQLAQARAAADTGLGVERASRVQENQALAYERRAKALHEEDSALLDKIKAVKELEQIDLNHLEKLISIANGLKMVDKVAQNIPTQTMQQPEQSQPTPPMQ